jgi:hypothetical protein
MNMAIIPVCLIQLIMIILHPFTFTEDSSLHALELIIAFSIEIHLLLKGGGPPARPGASTLLMTRHSVLGVPSSFAPPPFLASGKRISLPLSTPGIGSLEAPGPSSHPSETPSQQFRSPRSNDKHASGDAGRLRLLP